MQILAAIVVTLVLAFFVLSGTGCGKATGTAPKGPVVSTSAPPGSAAGSQSWLGEAPAEGPLSRRDVRKLLEDLARSKPPSREQLGRGAMCYSRAVPTGTVDVICSTCKGKSVIKRSWKTHDLEACLRLTQAISRTGRVKEVTLDTTPFCARCEKRGDPGKPLLVIRLQGEAKPHRSRVAKNDLQALLAFLQGKDRYKTDTDREFALRDHGRAIARILGVDGK